MNSYVLMVTRKDGKEIKKDIFAHNEDHAVTKAADEVKEGESGTLYMRIDSFQDGKSLSAMTKSANEAIHPSHLDC